MDIVIVLAISVIAFIHVHELGHFFAARLCGIKVLRLHIGVGPKLYSRADRHGTEIRWGLIPAAFTEVTNQDLAAVPPPYQLVFAAAGPVANFVCALVLLAVAYSTSLPPSQMATIGIVDANGPAFAAGIREGDRITALDGRLISNWTDVGLHLVGRVGDSGTVGFDVIRQDARQRFELPINDWQVDAASIDLFEDFGFRPAAPVQADTGSSSLVAGLTSAVVDTGRMFWSTAMAGFKMIFGRNENHQFRRGLAVDPVRSGCCQSWSCGLPEVGCAVLDGILHHQLLARAGGGWPQYVQGDLRVVQRQAIVASSGESRIGYRLCAGFWSIGDLPAV